jgi:hypothetical protein
MLRYFSLTILSIVIFSCKKFIQIDPPVTQITSATVFTSDATVTAAVSGIYSEMMAGPGFASGGLSSVTVMTALSSDELVNYSFTQDYIQFYTNAINPASNSVIKQAIWMQAYHFIYEANALVEGLSKSSGLTTATKNQILGEAKFIRAFCHFYLVGLFGDVPLVTSTDYRVNNRLARTPAAQVYSQIIQDLKDAETLMMDDYSFTAGERIRPIRWAAKALLSRVFLYQGEFKNAEDAAAAVIARNLFSLEADLSQVFLKNSLEAIWQLQPVHEGINTNEGELFILSGNPGSVSLSQQVMDAFEPGDQRKTSWTGSITTTSGTYYFPYKYKVFNAPTLSEYSMVLRLAELYLIRAEARARQGNISGAQDDLDTIRARAGLPPTTATDQASLLAAILHERQVELFTEWGHRWLDLKRTGQVDAVMSVVTPLKGGSWNTTQQLYPIPTSEIASDPNLSQNPGY